MNFTRRGLALSTIGAATVAAAPLDALAQATARPRIEDVINPEFRSALPLLRSLPTAPFSRANLAERRRRPPYAPALASPAYTQRSIPGPKGAAPVGVYVVNGGARGAARPAILHIHGGGFIAGDAASELRRSQDIAAALDAVVVSVDYRLAPETPFPGPLEDCYAALKWLQASAAGLGADARRIALYGGSAGGGLAAQLALLARDRGEVPLVFQALLYPMLDDRTASTRRTAPQQGLVVWTPADNVFGWTSYLGRAPGGASAPRGAVPARIENLKGLPPTWIGVGAIDLFVDEDIAYARRLVEAGVPTQLEIVPGAFHGFDLVPTPTVKRFMDGMIAALRTGLAEKA